ncbi:unnamed protein product [Prorocentrum cordatum]|uniref:Uncharacterized protein n=1 Tax=Prorocentrum cordatum TaxID=2364126 RepID=A0ABN9UEK0_9DINO|nr:unnamed protein product [Polarella glacialis]
MSVRVAFWCALFGFPIYSQANYELFYGSQLCSPSQLGRWVVGPNGTGIVPHEGAMDAGYIPWVAWLDCLGLTFLFLISKMSTNAIKFGLSWHLFFMMGYMNPNTGPHIGELHTGIPGVQWDSEPTAVLFTTYTGSLLAVLATLFPWPMLNITRVDEDTKTVVSSLDNIWEDAISYFCGGRHAAKRLQIASKIANLTNNISTVSGDLEASWWETLDLCGFKHKRALYAELDAELDQLHQVLYAMKACILEAGFGKTHEAFMDKSMRRAAENLKLATMRLLYHCAESCRDGKVDENELKQIVQCVGEIKHCQMLMLLEYDHKLSAAYGQELNSSNPLSDEPFCNCTIFVYSLSVFAWRVSAFAEGHLEKDGSRKRGSVVRNMFGWLHESSGEADAEHRNFAIRNTMSVTLCFVMGFYLRGSVFQTGYNATMATTLALLISRYAGTTFERNTKRLIGVALGKVLPILIMGLVNRLECNSTLQILAHVLAICTVADLITFEYMYFTSYQWDYVGLCAAAFGCTFFFTTCIQGGDADGQIKSNYVEIGQVILAIGVQITIDTLMKSKDTRQIATVYTHDLGQALQRGFREYFSGCDLSLSKYYSRPDEVQGCARGGVSAHG